MRNPITEDDLENIINANLPWSKFENKTVLVTGANGFLPSYMIETLLYLNEKRNNGFTKVFALVRTEKNAYIRFRNYKNRKDLDFIVQDVCNPLNLNEKLDFIIHAASQASPTYYKTDPVGTLCANTIGTYNLLNLAKEQNLEAFLFFSSAEVYGNSPSDHIQEKDYGYLDPDNLRSCYAESKRMGESMCVSFLHQYNVPTKIVRPFHIYGPGMNLNDGRVYADFVRDTLYSKEIIIKSDGRAIRSFCYLSDAIEGFFTVLLNGECGEAYNLGNEKAVTSIKNLAEILVSLVRDKDIRIKFDEKSNQDYLKSEISKTSPDISKIDKLGWKPKYPLEEGFLRTLKWFKCV